MGDLCRSLGGSLGGQGVTFLGHLVGPGGQWMTFVGHFGGPWRTVGDFVGQ